MTADSKMGSTGLNPGKAGPKGALKEKPGSAPRSGPPGNEGNNTRRDFVRSDESGGRRAREKRRRGS